MTAEKLSEDSVDGDETGARVMTARKLLTDGVQVMTDEKLLTDDVTTEQSGLETRPATVLQPGTDRHTTRLATDWLTQLSNSQRERAVSLSLSSTRGSKGSTNLGRGTRGKAKSVSDRLESVESDNLGNKNRQMSVKDMLRAMSSRAKPPTGE